jgi:beta-phosphoglucomutase
VAPVAALTFDFNGTLSDDEPILCAVFAELFAARGRPLPEAAYYAELAGLSDEAIVRRWLGDDYPDVPGAVAERIERYRSRVSDGGTVTEGARAALRYAAARVPVAIVSGAALAEIEPVIEAAGVASLLAAVVSADAVERGKPDPEGYLRALELLGVEAAATVAFEDTEAGVSAATAAGMRCVAVGRTAAPARLRHAEAHVAALEEAVVARLLAPA